MTGSVLSDNDKMRRLASALGFETARSSESPSLIEVERSLFESRGHLSQR